MCIEEIKIKEYEDLRSEIKQKMEAYNSLVTFMITTVIAVLVFAVENDNMLLYLLPFGIIIPISMRMLFYRASLAKIAAYIIVYIESDLCGLGWETRNNLIKCFDVYNNDFKLYDKFVFPHYYEGMVLSIICYILFFTKYIIYGNISKKTLIYAIIPVFFILWEYLIVKKIISFDKKENEWIKKWKDFKESDS